MTGKLGMSITGNERGFALVTVLSFAAILMAMMTALLNTNMIEILMSGTSSASKQSLAAADAGEEYVRGSFNLASVASFPASAGSSERGNQGAAARSALPSPLNERIAFVNLSGSLQDTAESNKKLENKGFSNKAVGGGGSSPGTLKVCPALITSRATARLITKGVMVDGGVIVFGGN